MSTITTTASARFKQSPPEGPTAHHQVRVVGGGTAGISVAPRLYKGWFKHPDIAILEPADKHYYQPLWTLFGGGAARREQTVRSESSVIPQDAAPSVKDDGSISKDLCVEPVIGPIGLAPTVCSTTGCPSRKPSRKRKRSG